MRAARGKDHWNNLVVLFRQAWGRSASIVKLSRFGEYAISQGISPSSLDVICLYISPHPHSFQALIPQLVHPLVPVPFKSTPVELQIVSLCALTTVIKQCAHRMPHWKGTIIDGIGRCWVDAVENESLYDNNCEFISVDVCNISHPDSLKRHLRFSCQALASAYSSVTEVSYMLGDGLCISTELMT